MCFPSRRHPQFVRSNGSPFLDHGELFSGTDYVCVCVWRAGWVGLSLFLGCPSLVHSQFSFSTLLTLRQHFSAFKDQGSQVYILQFPASWLCLSWNSMTLITFSLRNPLTTFLEHKSVSLMLFPFLTILLIKLCWNCTSSLVGTSLGSTKGVTCEENQARCWTLKVANVSLSCYSLRPTYVDLKFSIHITGSGCVSIW